MRTLNSEEVTEWTGERRGARMMSSGHDCTGEDGGRWKLEVIQPARKVLKVRRSQSGTGENDAK